MNSQLFPGYLNVAVFFDRRVDAERVTRWERLFEEQRSAIERDLGLPFKIVQELPTTGAICLVEASDNYNGPTLVLDRVRAYLQCGGTTMDEVEETFSHLRSLHQRRDGAWLIAACNSIDEAIDRVVTEVGTSYPAFALRNIDWPSLCLRFRQKVATADHTIEMMQEWLASLHDGHTWVRPSPPFGELPYPLRVVGDTATFLSVAAESPAYAHGVRAGDTLLHEDLAGWWRRTAATAHSKPYIVGRRLLAGATGSQRQLVARASDGRVISWQESIPALSWDPVISWRKLASGNGYLRIRAWLVGHGLEEGVDEAFAELHGCDKLIVYLRGNPGGNLVMAQAFRNRFLRSGGNLGWIQGTRPDGTLADKAAIVGEPASPPQRWLRDVVFLTDPSTYSASEDAILGLQGQSHVKVVGEASGGGSGRVRVLRLLPDWNLTISTALTYDLRGHVVEGHGIPVDIQVPSATALTVADK